MLSRITASLPQWRRALRRRRRLLALLVSALLIASAIPQLVPLLPRSLAVVVADGDLPAGTELTAADLRQVHVAAALVPEDAASTPQDLLGQRTAVPVSDGTPLLPGLFEAAGTPEVPDGSALIAVPIQAVLVPHLQSGTEIEIIASVAGDPAPQRISAQIMEISETGTGGTLGLGGGDGEAVALVSLAPARAADVARAMSEGWITIAAIG